MSARKVIIEISEFGPDLCIPGIGQICLSDFQLYDSLAIKRRVNRLYEGGLEPLHKAIEMEEGDIEKIIRFACNPQEKSGIEALKKELKRKYPEANIR